MATKAAKKQRSYSGKSKQKSMRGIPENEYREIKKQTCFCLTPTAIRLCAAIATNLDKSKSAVVEDLIRAQYQALLLATENTSISSEIHTPKLSVESMDCGVSSTISPKFASLPHV